MAGFGGGYVPGGSSAAVGTAIKNAAAAKPPPAPKAKPVPPVDPLAAWTQQQIAAQANAAANRYGTPQTPAQMQTTAQGMLDPVIAAIIANIKGQTQTASEQLSGNAASLAKQLAGIDYGAPYAGAEGKQAAVEAALQQSLSGGGQQLAQGLRDRLGAIGGGSVQSAASGLADRGAAIGTNAQAVGSAGLTNLIANEAAARAYGGQLPGIAQRQGLQDIAGVEAAGVKNIGDQTAQIMGQLPQIVENLRAQGLTLQQARAAAYQHVQDVLGGQNVSKATVKAGLAKADATLQYDYAKANAQNQQAATRAGIAQQNANTSSYNAQVRAAAAAAKAAAGKKPKALTASQLAKLTSTAHDLYNGVPPKQQYNAQTQTWMPVPGTGKSAVRWGTAVSQLMGAGASQAQAVQLLTAQGWVPGEGGRPIPPHGSKTQSQPAPVGTTMVQGGKTYQWTGTTWKVVAHP